MPTDIDLALRSDWSRGITNPQIPSPQAAEGCQWVLSHANGDIQGLHWYIYIYKTRPLRQVSCWEEGYYLADGREGAWWRRDIIPWRRREECGDVQRIPFVIVICILGPGLHTSNEFQKKEKKVYATMFSILVCKFWLRIPHTFSSYTNVSLRLYSHYACCWVWFRSFMPELPLPSIGRQGFCINLVILLNSVMYCTVMWHPWFYSGWTFFWFLSVF